MTAVDTLIKDCLNTIEKKYGEKGRHFLAYHNTEHARDVMEAAEAMGVLAGVSSSDLGLLKIAACFHDIEHGLKGSENERVSAQIAADEMRRAGYDEGSIEKVRNMILATIVTVEDATIIQSADENILNQIIADADLASFGREFYTYWDRASKHRAEWSGKTIFTDEEDKAFTEHQIAILQNHSFYTRHANMAFPHKQANIQELTKVTANR